MDFYEELLLSAAISILLAFLLSALSSARPDPAPAASSSGEVSSGTMGPNPSPGAGEAVEIERVAEVEAEVEVEVEAKAEAEEEGWEKFERSEAEERFRRAAEYMASGAGRAAARGLDGAAQMRLFALHKVATEGPCREPPPMALKLASRARWNAWQRLGSMSPEVAMEQYVALLSERFPGWAEATLREEAKGIGGTDIPGSEVSESNLRDSSTTLHPEHELAVERLTEGSSFNNADVGAADSKQSNQGLTKTFIFNLLSPTRVTFLS